MLTFFSMFLSLTADGHLPIRLWSSPCLILLFVIVWRWFVLWSSIEWFRSFCESAGKCHVFESWLSIGNSTSKDFLTFGLMEMIFRPIARHFEPSWHYVDAKLAPALAWLCGQLTCSWGSVFLKKRTSYVFDCLISWFEMDGDKWGRHSASGVQVG